CNCGTKYAFDVTPEMVAQPVQLVCQNCGADNSMAVNMIIQQQFGATATESAPPPPTLAPPAPSVESAPRIKVKLHTAAAAPAPEQTETASAEAPQMCRKHP